MIFNKFLIDCLGKTNGVPFGGADPEQSTVGLKCFGPILTELLSFYVSCDCTFTTVPKMPNVNVC